MEADSLSNSLETVPMNSPDKMEDKPLIDREKTSSAEPSSPIEKGEIVLTLITPQKTNTTHSSKEKQTAPPHRH